MLRSESGEAKPYQRWGLPDYCRWRAVRPAQTVGLSRAADMPARNPGPGHQITLSEEEVSDVSLATFYVFDKENTALVSPSVQLVRGGLWWLW